MFIRLSLSLFLVGIGIGSPWLVRDWLGARTGEPRARSLHATFAALPERAQPKKSEKSGGAAQKDGSTEPGLERQPYPFASQSRRILQGFLNPSTGTESREKIPFAGSGAIPSTPRTQAIAKDASERLRAEMGTLSLRVGDPVFLRLFKEESELEIWVRGRGEKFHTLLKVFRIADCAGSPGPKLREGDGQAPEGFYEGSAANLKPETRHHLGFDLGYPNVYDRYHGFTGSDLMIHGGTAAAGSFALPREGMEEVYSLVEAAIQSGQKAVPIHIFPFRMTDRRMDQVWKTQPRHLDFWVNLKEGYDFFENVRQPPLVEVSVGKYAFRMAKEEN